jgi:hypothetical protein
MQDTKQEASESFRFAPLPFRIARKEFTDHIKTLKSHRDFEKLGYAGRRCCRV